MIVLDSSILVGIIKFEADLEAVISLLDTEECTIGAPTLVETRAWCTINLIARRSRWLAEFIAHEAVSVLPFNREMADAASKAFEQFGRASGHPAKLNFGDCMAYAVSATMRAPLLFKGRDFGLTDVMPHPASIRTGA
ncbi:MAG: type II toxin-antitoxin system VapC family toxin [Bryobacteraceae bacterium]